MWGKVDLSQYTVDKVLKEFDPNLHGWTLLSNHKTIFWELLEAPSSFSFGGDIESNQSNSSIERVDDEQKT